MHVRRAAVQLRARARARGPRRGGVGGGALGYVEPGSYFQTRLFHWHEGATPPVATAEMPVLEMVTSPNNPDGTPAV